MDYLVKHELKAKFYIRYVDDFVILHDSREQLEVWKEQISSFLREKLKLELHPEKSQVVSLSNGVDFVGFRNFYCFKLLRKRSIKKMFNKITNYHECNFTKAELLEIFQGFQAYSKWANSFKLRKKIVQEIYRSS